MLNVSSLRGADGGESLGKWEEYLDFLDENEYSLKVLIGNLKPAREAGSVESIKIDNLSYDL